MCLGLCFIVPSGTDRSLCVAIRASHQSVLLADRCFFSPQQSNKHIKDSCSLYSKKFIKYTNGSETFWCLQWNLVHSLLGGGILKLNVLTVLSFEPMGFLLETVEFQTRQTHPAFQSLPNRNIEGSRIHIFFLGILAAVRGDRAKWLKRRQALWLNYEDF